MWIFLVHGLGWVPKVFFYAVQRLAVWSGTVYLFRKGKTRRVYYVYSAALYLGSWALFLFLVRQSLSFHLSNFPHLFLIPRRIS